MSSRPGVAVVNRECANDTLDRGRCIAPPSKQPSPWLLPSLLHFMRVLRSSKGYYTLLFRNYFGCSHRADAATISSPYTASLTSRFAQHVCHTSYVSRTSARRLQQHDEAYCSCQALACFVAERLGHHLVLLCPKYHTEAQRLATWWEFGVQTRTLVDLSSGQRSSTSG